ncbi:MAG: hypothetical protein IPO87_07395 [Flavobacteriales bacterium]|nr:hypothetical protein [Flavobacteriales bacterium]
MELSKLGIGNVAFEIPTRHDRERSFDSLEIYDGTDATGTLLYQHTGEAVNLGPVGSGMNTSTVIFDEVEVYSTTGNFFMLMNSDGSVQCNGSTTYDQWEWEVVCLDCTIPVVSYTIVDDCANNQFSIPIEVTDTGDGAAVNIVFVLNGVRRKPFPTLEQGSRCLGHLTRTIRSMWLLSTKAIFCAM